jgi:hypothetical protein
MLANAASDVPPAATAQRAFEKKTTAAKWN